MTYPAEWRLHTPDRSRRTPRGAPTGSTAKVVRPLGAAGVALAWLSTSHRGNPMTERGVIWIIGVVWTLTVAAVVAVCIGWCP